MTVAGELSYRVLGPLEVRRGERPVDLGSPKQRLLLAALVMARGRVVAADRLVDIVWGDAPPAGATSNLQVYVSRLRAALKGDGGEVPLVRRAPGYALEVPPGALDGDDLLAAADAVGAAVGSASWQKAHDAARAARPLWRGPVLADLEGDWIVGEAGALQGRWVDLRCGQVTALLGLRRPEDAVAEALALLDEAPLREDVTRLAMLALHQAGRTPEALAVHARHVELLDTELGIEPAAELRDLHVDLLRQEPWTATWPGESSAVPAADALVGRDAELEVGDRLVEEVLGGQVRCVVLTGPAGIGKTRLAEELCDRLRRRGGEQARGRSLDEPGAPAWWPLRQLVRDLGADPDEVLRAPGGADADTVRFAVYDQVRELVDARARRAPLALLVDDLQWADPATLGCLTSLTATPRPVPVLLVVTVRDGEGDPAATRAAAALLRGPGARHLVVPPLAEGEVHRLAERVAGRSVPDDELHGLAARTGGNALFVSEYARLPAGSWTADELPLAISGVLARRLDVLDAPALQTLRAAAVVGEVWDPPVVGAVVAAVAGDDTGLLDHLDAAADAAIVVPDEGGQGFRFAHALLRQQVLAGLSSVRRSRLHLAVAAALTTAGPEQLTQRAQHLVAAGPLAPTRDVLDACRAAALQAEQRVASESAARWWAEAVRVHDTLAESERDPQERDDLLVARVRALVRAGRGQTVLEIVGQGLADAEALGRTTTVGRLAGALLRSSGTWPWIAFGGHHQEALVEQLAALEEFVRPDAAAHARLLAALAVGHCYDTDLAVAEALSARALELAEAAGDPAVLADAIVGRVLTFVGEARHAEEAEDLLGRLAALRRPGGEVDEVLADSARTMSSLSLGDVTRVEALLAAGTRGADRLRLPLLRAQLRWMEVGLTHWREGAEAALAACDEATAVHQRTELYDGGFGALVRLVLLFDLGRLTDEEPYEGFEPDVWGAATASARGDTATAVDLLRRRLDDTTAPTWSTLAHLVIAGTVVADLGATDLAPAALARLDPYAGRLASLGQGPVLGPVDLPRARLLALTGQHEAAWQALGAAASLSAREGGLAWEVRCRDAAGELRDLRLADDPRFPGLPTELRSLLIELDAQEDGPDGRYRVGGAVLEITADAWLELVDAWRAEADGDSGPDALRPEHAGGHAAAEVEVVFASKGRRRGLVVTVRGGEVTAR